MNETNKLYQAMLKCWGVTVNDNAALNLIIGNNELPVKLEGMQVYLPVSNLLENNITGKAFFHPACESIMSKETEMFKIIRKVSGMTLMMTFQKYFTVLSTVSKKRNKKNLRIDQIEMLEPFKQVTDTEINEITRLLDKMTPVVDPDSQQDNRFINFQITKGGKSLVSGERIYYKTKAVFPFYNELSRRLNRSGDLSDSSQLEINGVSITKRSLSLAVHLFKSVFPGIGIPDMYESEHTRPDAARLCSYCYSFGMVAEDMNKVQNNFREEFDKAGIYCIDMGWLNQLDDIGDIFRQIPPMQYNNQNTKTEHESVSVNNNLQNVLNTNFNTPATTTEPNAAQYQQVNSSVGNRNNIIVQNGVEYDVTAPILLLDETYNGYSIDPYTTNVVHRVTGGMGQQIAYRCTRHGNVLLKEGQQQQQQHIPQYYQNAPQQQQYTTYMHPGQQIPSVSAVQFSEAPTIRY